MTPFAVLRMVFGYLAVGLNYRSPWYVVRSCEWSHSGGLLGSRFYTMLR